MESDSGATVSIWMRSVGETPEHPPLAANVECDVCIVGAGISGLTAAYELAIEGKRVVVLDDGTVGGGESSRTTAHLASALDDRIHEIERTFGARGARLAVESHAAAIDEMERIAAEEGIECDFQRVDGYLFLGGDSKESELDEELSAARRAGLDVEKLPRLPIATLGDGPCLRFARQGQMDMMKYLVGLARAIERHGGKIHGRTHATEMTDGTPCTVKTKGGHTVRARDVIVATNTPVNDWVTMHTKQAPYRTYVIGMRVPAGAIPPGLYWDTPDPYHYVRLEKGAHASGTDVLIVGGEDHKTGQKHDMEARWRSLEEWARPRFPMATTVDYRWSGQVMEPVDYMGFIGRNPGNQHVYIITGDSGQGTTHGTIGGLLCRDLILGRPNAWTELYDPSRKTMESLTTVMEFAKENLNVALQYRDYLTPGQVHEIMEIQPGSGAVLRQGAKKVAVFKADDGAVHVRSAVCPHLYCIVDWNSAERSWDCPCHGSRFDAFGKVLNGPANTDLAMIDDKEQQNGRKQDGKDAERQKPAKAGATKDGLRETEPGAPSLTPHGDAPERGPDA